MLSPGLEYPDFIRRGTENRIELPIAGNFYKPQGKQPKGPKVRHNQWRYVDYDGDNDLDLVVGIEDWSDYGWDDAWDSAGKWTNGPLHGFVLLAEEQRIHGGSQVRRRRKTGCWRSNSRGIRLPVAEFC